jgi:WD40 repeat protein
MEGHTSLVSSVAFSPDGAHIVSGSNDKTIRVWDAMTGHAIMEPIQAHTKSVSSVVFSPDGLHIASGSFDHTIRVWDVSMGFPTANKLGPSPVDLNTSAFTLPHVTGSWIRGPNQELIMWVPPEYRFYLQLSPRFITIASARVNVDMSSFVHGPDWVKCCSL